MRYAALSLLASANFLGLSQPAFAQTVPAGEVSGPTDDGDMVVTATRNETLLSKTPIAMTAITGADLMQSGITNPTQLEQSVPNLSIVRSNGLQITVRSVTSTDGTEKGDPSAAFMPDGIYLARPQAQEVSFFDISRVEVLRGPQGTLFGRNTTAGLVHLISNKPEPGAFGGSIDLGYGNFSSMQATGVLNIPVGESMAHGAAVNYDRRDSYLIPGPTFTTKLDPFRQNLSVRLSRCQRHSAVGQSAHIRRPGRLQVLSLRVAGMDQATGVIGRSVALVVFPRFHAATDPGERRE